MLQTAAARLGAVAHAAFMDNVLDALEAAWPNAAEAAPSDGNEPTASRDIHLTINRARRGGDLEKILRMIKELDGQLDDMGSGMVQLDK